MALTDNILSWYKMDENAASTAVDDLAGNCPGTAARNTNLISTTDAIIGTALDFDGGTDSISQAGSNALANTWTVAGFFKLNDAGADASRQALVNWKPGSGDVNRIELEIVGGVQAPLLQGHIMARITSSTGSVGGVKTYSGNTLTVDATWYHIAETWDGTNLKLYINAVEDTPYTIQDDTAVTMTSSVRNKRLGRNTGGATFYFYGTMDLVGFWARTLSAAEISQLYNGGAGILLPFTMPGKDLESKGNIRPHLSNDLRSKGNIRPHLSKDLRTKGRIKNVYPKNLQTKANLTYPTVTVLMVGGGGGGGGTPGGGGGAGGYLYTFNAVSPGAHPITVGDGGLGGAVYYSGNNGEDSVFDTLIAYGGGGGGCQSPGVNGASGGGAGTRAGYSYAGGIATPPGQGYNGGASNCPGSAVAGGGGGGGASAVGQNGYGSGTPTNPVGGDGGNGLANSISGASVYYSGGGGGWGTIPGGGGGGDGGLGGGGHGGDFYGNPYALPGTPNTGGGGGGSGNSTYPGANGGSGIVIISYPTGYITALGGTITTSGGNTIHTFTADGTFEVGVVWKDLESKARLYKKNYKDLRTKGSLKLVNRNDLRSKGNIRPHLPKDLRSKGNIKTTNRKDLETKGRIKHTYPNDLRTKGNLWKTTTTYKDLRSKGSIKKTNRKDLESRGSISGSIKKDLRTKGNILFLGIAKTILVSPLNTSTTNSPITFVWEIPADSYNRNIVSHIQIDQTSAAFGNIEAEKVSSIDAGFQYWDGASWVAYPAAGVGPIYYGNQARILIPLTLGLKYWRVRGEA